jgi:hypothetical protein
MARKSVSSMNLFFLAPFSIHRNTLVPWNDLFFLVTSRLKTIIEMLVVYGSC